MSDTPPTIDSLAIGDRLPRSTRRASRAQLFLYSAASFNPHRIHYDRDYAAVEGHDDVLVHGPLQGAWLTQYLTDWMGPAGRLVSVAWQNRASAFPEQDYEFGATVVGLDRETGVVELELWERDRDGRILMPATATVRLPLPTTETAKFP